MQPPRRPRSTRQRPPQAAQRHVTCTLALLAILSCSSLTANALEGDTSGSMRPKGGRCAIEHDDQTYAEARAQITAAQRHASTSRIARAAMSSVIYVPVYWHVITKADGTGTVPESQMTEQIRIMNNAYAPHFSFLHASVDTYVNDVWYSQAA